MTKTACVTKLRFHKPGRRRGVHNFLKYCENRDGSVRRAAKLATGRYVGDDNRDVPKLKAGWLDHGLGKTHREIYDNLQEMRAKKTFSRDWVITPDPEVIKRLPKEERLAFVERLTERTMDAFYEENGWGKPEYSAVLHEKQTTKKGIDIEQPHAHVITPGTVPIYDDTGELLGRMPHYIKRPHYTHLQQVVNQELRLELEQTLGREQAEEIMQQRDQRLAYQAKRVEKPRFAWTKLAQVHEVSTLLKQYQKNKNKKKTQQDKERQRMEYVRLFVRHRALQSRERAQEQRRKEWEIDRLTWQGADEALHEAELEQAQRDQREHRARQAMKLRAERQRGWKPLTEEQNRNRLQVHHWLQERYLKLEGIQQGDWFSAARDEEMATLLDERLDQMLPEQRREMMMSDFEMDFENMATLDQAIAQGAVPAMTEAYELGNDDLNAFYDYRQQLEHE